MRIAGARCREPSIRFVPERCRVEGVVQVEQLAARKDAIIPDLSSGAGERRCMPGGISFSAESAAPDRDRSCPDG